MKRLLPILLLATLALTSCVKDDIASCSATMHLYFSYIYGGTNRFFETVTTPTHLIFYKAEKEYREVAIPVDEVGITDPYRFLKTPADGGDIEIIAWTQDDALNYINTPASLLGEGNIKLKELTPGTTICRPVDDLLYGHMAFDAGNRFMQNTLILPFVRAVCRTRITMTPRAVEDGDFTRAGETKDDVVVIPRPGDYTFHLKNTRSGVNYDNTHTNIDKVILQPNCYYDETTGNITTHWFGTFSSEGEYLRVNAFVKDKQVADFDCEPIGITSIPGDYLDLLIDKQGTRLQMKVYVNGWKVATVESNL